MSRTTTPPTEENLMPDKDKRSSDKKVSAERSRPPTLDFYARLHNKEVTIKTTAGNQITGTLRAYSPYDLLIEINGGEQIILPKHAIAFTSSPTLKRREEGVA